MAVLALILSFGALLVAIFRPIQRVVVSNPITPAQQQQAWWDEGFAAAEISGPRYPEHYSENEPAFIFWVRGYQEAINRRLNPN